MVTWDNYEEYLVMQADGELDAAGQAELEIFLKAHPELREEQAIYAKVKLVPDVTETYGNRESLLREEPKRRTIRFGSWRQYSAAAGIVALIAIALMKWEGEEQKTIGKAEDTTEQVSAPQVANMDTAASIKEEKIAVQEEQPAPEIAPQQRQKQQVQLAVVNNEKRNIPKGAALQRIDVSIQEQLASAGVTKPSAELVEIPELPQVDEPAPEPYRDALAWLPVSDERKQGLNEIKNAVESRFERVKEISNNVKNTDLAVKLGKKELFTIRF